MKIVDVDRLRIMAQVEFRDIVMEGTVSDLNELRIFLRDGSFIDIWFSLKRSDRYSYHWERRALDGTIYRHDNIPHRRWQDVSTFPRHFHDGTETDVKVSSFCGDPEKDLRTFLAFVREKTK